MTDKKKKRAQRDGDGPELDLTPMIDIVFNLLIFFMCATQFRLEEGAIKAYLPKGLGLNEARAEDPIDLQTVRLKLLWVDEGGVPTEAKRGRVVLKIEDMAFNSPGELEAASPMERSPVWSDLYASLVTFRDSYSGENLDGLPVTIDARKQIPTKFVISALNEVVRAKIKNVTFAAPELGY